MADRPPDETTLRAAALAHLGRYATTRAGLVRVLDRRIDRWARAAETPPAEDIRAAKALVRNTVDRLAAEGLVDDAAFAEMRTRSLLRTGHSRRAIAAHLALRGVAAEAVVTALPDDAESELAAALACAWRRRIGPFRRAAVDADGRRRELGTLARAGFGHDVAARALAFDPIEAAALVNNLRRG